MSRFGVNVDILVANGQKTFLSTMVHPDTDYRACMISGELLPADGWQLKAID